MAVNELSHGGERKGGVLGRSAIEKPKKGEAREKAQPPKEKTRRLGIRQTRKIAKEMR
jgi:hypothetical protein